MPAMTLLFVIGTTSLIFALDLLFQSGLTWPVLYLFPLLVTFSLPNRMAPVQFATIATFLISLETFAVRSHSPLWPTLVNQALTTMLLWGSIPLIHSLLSQPPTSAATANGLQPDEQKRLRHLFGERVKELTALHQAVRLLQDSTKPIEEVLHQIIVLLPPAWQYPEITAAQITFDGTTITTPGFVASPWRQSASWATMDGAQGTIDIVYREARPPETEGPFLAEERDLINSLADSLSSYLNRRRAELALREAHERLQALSQQLMEVQEIERRRLAHDLHDEIGQALTVVKMNLQTMQRLSDTSAITTPLNDSKDMIDQILHHIRNLSLDLRPILLDDLGLVPALRWYLNRQAERTGWTFDVAMDDALPALPQTMATACFRIVQEAITNIIRHSHATRVSVSLQREAHDLYLSICDNGAGFDVQAALDKSASGQSMGLLGMQERVRFLNGSISIESTPGQGTEIRVRIPVSSFTVLTTAGART